MIAAIAGVGAATGLTPSTVFANHEFATNMTGQHRATASRHPSNR